MVDRERAKLAVYIAGPISTGQDPLTINLHNPVVVQRLQNAIEFADRLRFRGLYPYVPHLTIGWNHYLPRSQEYWMELDLFWLSKCNALFRMPGESSGADQEVTEAEALAIPIFHNERSLYAWADSLS